MAITAWYDVWCDVCRDWVKGGSTKKEAWQSAKVAGWTMKQYKILCPRCQKTQPKKKPTSEVK